MSLQDLGYLAIGITIFVVLEIVITLKWGDSLRKLFKREDKK